MVRALPVSSLDDDDDMQWEAAEADYVGDAADGSGRDYGDGTAAGFLSGGDPEGLQGLAGSPPTSWEDRHELQGACIFFSPLKSSCQASGLRRQDTRSRMCVERAMFRLASTSISTPNCTVVLAYAL